MAVGIGNIQALSGSGDMARNSLVNGNPDLWRLAVITLSNYGLKLCLFLIY